MHVGATNGKILVGMTADGKHMALNVEPDGNFTVGVALDLDNGRFYWSQNGSWRYGEPGSAEGSAVALGEDYALRVMSTGPSLSGELNLGAIVVNTGQTPFKYSTPAGYQPFYGPPAAAFGDNPIDWIVPSYQKVAGKSYGDWAGGYWAWLLVKPPDRSVTEDMTGQYCGDGQSGPVWFLSGADEQSRIVRSCNVPRGKFLLVPAVMQIMSSTVGSAPCAALEKDQVAKAGTDR